MHHSGKLDPEMEALLKKEAEKDNRRLETALDLFQRPKVGATGRFPEGKLTKDDEGEIAIAIAHTGEKVIVDFGKPIAWIGLNAKQARDIAATLVKHAEEVEKAKVAR